MMATGQHDELLIKEAETLREIASRLTGVELNLKISNLLAIAKESYALDNISKEEYVKILGEVWELAKN